ncbi:MAG: hypothetical protein JWP08_4087 [Bryobacterales bacterium]|nr:hypothetical protein [Bryobacterales bacterium]
MSRTVVIRCIFCDVILDASQKNLPSSSTKEHVFARWLGDAIVNKSKHVYGPYE